MRHGPSLGPPLVFLFPQALSQTKTKTEKKTKANTEKKTNTRTETDKKEDRNKEKGETGPAVILSYHKGFGRI